MLDDMVIPWAGKDSVSQLIDATFPDLADNSEDQDYLLNRALITPLNENVNKLNDRVVIRFPGEEHTYYSFDSVEDDFQNLYLQEHLNEIAPGGLPLHELKLKVGAPVMLLRNVSAKNGLCNGTSLIINNFFPNCIDAVILSGNSAGKRVSLHRLPMSLPENLEMSFKIIHKQFAVHMYFAFTINKARGETIENTGIYLLEHVFSHGQLYVRLSGVFPQQH
ncbi:ATP-dependent DNA helicase PIF1-like [Papaver somniferum]|uniref:ATP-dependent DNA helicase PIF1-like n=1 Tax=Papaver somniferum TaxID=3469 RepID=UPI000E6FE7E4|nr:ATP-dependent DNA helicase PIF1-like [Papaver somniferum]